MTLDEFRAEMSAEFVGKPFDSKRQQKAASRIVEFVADVYEEGEHLFDPAGVPILDSYDVQISTSWDDTCLMLSVFRRCDA